MSNSKRPTLLWAVSHRTLFRADVPALEAAGIDVIPELPELSVLRDIDFIEYPAFEDRLDRELTIASAVRFWARSGMLEPQEQSLIRRKFDGVMIGTRLDVAINVCRWFPGPVFLRYFGELPGVVMPRIPTNGELPSNLFLVPILKSLAHSALGQHFPNPLVLESPIPVPPVAPHPAEVSFRNRVGVFLGGYQGDVLSLSRSIRAHALANTEWVIFGCETRLMDSIQEVFGASARILSFLPEQLYWEEFVSLHVMVYPHGDEVHTHYTPFECALLNIPCVMRAGTPFGVEYLERVLDPGLRAVCAVSDEELGVALHTIQSNPVIASEISRRQRVVAELRSPSMIAASAERITNVLTQFSGKQLERPDSDLTGLPVVEGTQLLQRSGNGDHRKVEVQAAAIATSPVLGLGIDAALVPSPSSDGLWRTHLNAGAEVWLRLAQPGSLLNPVSSLAKVVVTLEWFDQCPEGLHLVVHDGENRFVCRSEMEIRELDGASFADVVVRELGADHSMNLEVRAGCGQKNVVLGHVTLDIHRF